MMILLFFYIFTMMIIVIVNSNNNFYKMHKSVPRSDFIKLDKAPGNIYHEVIFSIKQLSISVLETLLHERTNPNHMDYRQWLSYDEILKITHNPDGAIEVQQWLENHEIEIISTSNNYHYIKAIARIDKWEEILNTEFFIFKDLSYIETTTEAVATTEAVEDTVERGVYIRANEYSIPYSLQAHVTAIFNTVQIPPKLLKQNNYFIHKQQQQQHQNNNNIYTHTHITDTEITANTHRKLSNTTKTEVTISFLNKLYNITSNIGDVTQTQAVFAMANEYYSTIDLTLFQEYYNLTQQPALHPYGFNTTYCNITQNQRCYEGNLNIQYIMGISQYTKTLYWYVNTTHDPFVDWITTVADMVEPPLVHALSWGAIEQVGD